MYLVFHRTSPKETNLLKQVYITSRKARDLQSASEELSALGPGSCIPLSANLQEYGEVVRLSEELRAREVMLHVLVNNAGTAWNAPLDEFPVRTLPDAWQIMS
jgi:short-subunit dehydrogenase